MTTSSFATTAKQTHKKATNCKANEEKYHVPSHEMTARCLHDARTRTRLLKEETVYCPRTGWLQLPSFLTETNVSTIAFQSDPNLQVREVASSASLGRVLPVAGTRRDLYTGQHHVKPLCHMQLYFLCRTTICTKRAGRGNKKGKNIKILVHYLSIFLDME